MREIVLDTETTGFEPADGHRIVEIGVVELVDHLPTGASRQFYLHPERLVPVESQRIHGLTDEFLADKPKFAEIVEELLDFIGDAPLVIHNASFDLKFMNSELHRVGRPPLPYARAIDTVEIAKNKLPGARYSLDELCKRFAIDLTARTKHGALLDAELTAQVYLELVGGRQKKLSLDPIAIAQVAEIRVARIRPVPLPQRVTAGERAAHADFVAKELGEKSLWALIMAAAA
ncbi:MAG: DNA polymerase III subunit epsilon [Alphaproteobacteria bacterium]|nr:DNA polymerase III subunit epsilon [Alphaproteobacteria bacterium]MBL6938990.1 DNA polymerase III subunit epsilon [Alphaproteobacteria bacterium]MBL7099582.1 DNA polymerase III subunit epsilon [Alphaproteobacteria bacterium]